MGKLLAKSVLFISYFFPPVGGAGVQRAAKFAKFLPEHGWSPVVLTVENPSVPLFDETLSNEIPDSVKIIKAKTYEPSYQAKKSVSASAKRDSKDVGVYSLLRKTLRGFANFVLQPDPQILWFLSAKNAANNFLKSNKVDAIFATAPPYSSLLLAAHLAKKYRIPLLLDYRDEWDISNEVWENKGLNRISRAIQNRMQNYVIKRANTIVATTYMSTMSIRGKVKKLGASCDTLCIYNGYDSQDFQTSQVNEKKSNGKYVLSYVGTLWNLTSIEPVILAIEKLAIKFPELFASLSLVVAGRKTANQQALLQRLVDSKVTLTCHDYLVHYDAIQLMLESQGLCLLLSDINMARRVVPAKIFEYLATKNSIFVVAPEGEVWDLVKDYPRAYCAEPSDIDNIVSLLANDIDRFLREGNTKVEGYSSEKYERRAQALQLAQALNRMLNRDSN
ncbi:MAG: hypothetical protein JKY51_05080 [Opitutaceae bacterium]|nr:hypothetical protein [Opitutaceae bacterium]